MSILDYEFCDFAFGKVFCANDVEVSVELHSALGGKWTSIHEQDVKALAKHFGYKLVKDDPKIEQVKPVVSHYVRVEVKGMPFDHSPTFGAWEKKDLPIISNLDLQDKSNPNRIKTKWRPVYVK